MREAAERGGTLTGVAQHQNLDPVQSRHFTLPSNNPAGFRAIPAPPIAAHDHSTSLHPLAGCSTTGVVFTLDWFNSCESGNAWGSVGMRLAPFPVVYRSATERNGCWGTEGGRYRARAERGGQLDEAPGARLTPQARAALT